MPTLNHAAIEMTRKAAETLIANLEAMPADKQTWQPLDVGRSALSQVQECAVMAGFFGTILRDRVVPEMSFEQYKAACAALETAQQAIDALRAGIDELSAIIEKFPEAALGESIAMPWAEGMTMTYQEIMFSSYWNMVYHHGQIAYIQVLYGDREMYGMP